MTARKNRESAVRKILGSWALEGFHPDQEFLALLKRYVSGEMTLQQIEAIVDAQFHAAGNRKR